MVPLGAGEEASVGVMEMVLKWWEGARLRKPRQRFGFYFEGSGEPWRVYEQGRAVF